MENSFEEIKSNIKRIKETLDNTAIKFNRNPKDIRLMAVTKMNSAERVNVALNSGIDLIGENKVQEYLNKINDYKGSFTTHFIGHLQTNKVNKIIDKVNLIESVGSISLLECINKNAEKVNSVMPVLLEINIGKEETKTGFFIEELPLVLDKMDSFNNIKLRGLMCIPPSNSNDLEIEHYFDKIYNAFIDIKANKIDNNMIDILSMGMSQDYALAIKHGSTEIRIGRGIFGERNYSK